MFIVKLPIHVITLCICFQGNNFGGSTSSGIGLHGHHNSSASDYGSIGGSSGHVTPQHIASNQQSHTNISVGQHHTLGPDGSTSGMIGFWNFSPSKKMSV